MRRECLGVDPYRSTDPTNLLHEAGFEVVQVGQGFLKMADPLEELKRAILNGQFRHGGNPLLRMCFGNAVAIKDGHDNEKLVKKRSTGRIDGACASANATARIMQAAPDGTPGFVFVDSQVGFYGEDDACWKNGSLDHD